MHPKGFASNLELHYQDGQWITTNREPIPTSRLVLLEASHDLKGWREAARFQGDFLFNLRDIQLQSSAFYRMQSIPMGKEHDWKNQIHWREESFRNIDFDNGSGPSRWVKFLLLLGSEPKVIFQDSGKYPFHYDFAVTRLQPFLGLTPQAFNDVTLFPGPQQQAVLGAVVFPPDHIYSGQPVASEVGIQFVGKDPYPIEEIIQWFHWVEEAIYTVEPIQAFYMPTYEQSERAVQEADRLREAEISLSNASRWASTHIAYAHGWGFGRLVFVPTEQIAAAYEDGTLTARDILITDGVPAELPPLAGILSLFPSTPNSHVAILARSYGIPFVHLVSDADQAEVLGWVDRVIVFSATENFGSSMVEIFPVDSERLDDATRALLYATLEPPPLDYRPKESPGHWSVGTHDLRPADIVYYGGKAANFGILNRSIPNNSPQAIAFSFDLWDAFVEADSGFGMSLRDWIAIKLEPFMVAHPPIGGMKTVLEEVRERIQDVAFPGDLRQPVISALASFDPDRKIRFRSSTNLEDSETFTGAGLYDSFSGCLADDLDSNNSGPSICDPSESKERGVFRAIQKVFASFYNDNAFLERRRRQVIEEEAGMALLVHYSFPDELEWANGVAGVSVSSSGDFSSIQGDLVTQLGALSVSNPEPGSIPEVVEVSQFQNSGAFLELRAASSSVVLGETVMDWQADYLQLTDLLKKAGLAYLREFPNKEQATLDFEYKKVEPGDLVIKQIREIPDETKAGSPDFILLDKPMDWSVHQGEHADLFATHRLKATWQLQTRQGLLEGPSEESSLYEHLKTTWTFGKEVLEIDDKPSDLGAYGFQVVDGAMMDRWETQTAAERIRHTLSTRVLDYLLNPAIPIATEEQFEIRWSVEYEHPKPTFQFSGETSTRLDEVILKPTLPVNSRSLLQTRTMILPKQVTITTTFYWPEPPTGPTAGYTAPLIAWKETTIEGWTDSPIVLTSPYAQTYVPGHHNFWEDFLFEPERDPSVLQQSIDQLKALDIQAIHVTWDGQDAQARVLGLDEMFRKL